MRVAISFTGGKDSVLATHLVLNARLRALAGWKTGEGDILEHLAQSGGGGLPSTPTPTPTPVDLDGEAVAVVALVLFAPPPPPAPPAGNDETNDNNDADDRGFKAHPLRLVRAQAAALGAGIAAATAETAPPPFLILDVTPPHADSYAAQLAHLRDAHGVDALVTGDVLDVCSGFMARACARAGLRLITPLWQQPRERILAALGALGIHALVTCVDVDKFKGATDVDPVADLLGRELTREVWAEGQAGALRRAHSSPANVDLCGEGGEYHSAVFAAEHLFHRRLRVEVAGHAFKGERYAHVVLGRVEGDDDGDDDELRIETK